MSDQNPNDNYEEEENQLFESLKSSQTVTMDSGNNNAPTTILLQDDNDDDTCWVPGNIFSDVSTAPGGNLLVLSTPGGVYKLIDQR